MFERLAVAQAPGVATVGSGSHPAMLPRHWARCHRNGRTSLTSALTVGDDLQRSVTALVHFCPWFAHRLRTQRGLKKLSVARTPLGAPARYGKGSDQSARCEAGAAQRRSMRLARPRRS
jgi:hypothetical protein